MFSDGLGERRHIVNPSGDRLEVLLLRGELTSIPSFEFALRERVSHLAQFRQACYTRVRSVERLNDPSATLTLVSDFTDGVRLSALVDAAERETITLDINAALCLIRQIVPAVARLHEAAPQVAHGAVAPDRIIVTPNAHVILPEYVLGAALEQLRYSQERYWKDLRVATARVGGLPRFDHRSDVTAVGVVALSLIAARRLRDEEFPARLPEVLGSAWAISARGGLEPLPAGLRAWLGRALQLDARNSFSTMAEAQAELDRVLGDSDYLAAPAALETVLAQYRATSGPTEPVAAAPASLPHAVNEMRPPAAAPVAVPAPAAPAVASPAMAMTRETASAFGAPNVGVLADSLAAPRGPAPGSKPAAKPAANDAVVIVSPREPGLADELYDVDEEPPARGGRGRWIAAAVLVLAMIGGGAFAARKYIARAAAPATGTVVVTTNPAGAQLLVDGVLRGTTPVSLTVAPGAHTLIVRGDGTEPRTIPVTVTAGAQISQYLDLPKSAPASGQIEVRTEPAGVQVSVDGTPRGASPVTIPDLTPGDHTVTVESDLGKVQQTVTVNAGALSSVLVPLGAPRGAPLSGWIQVSAPAEVQLYENGKLIGSSQTDRLMVSTGAHQIDLVNDTLGYRESRTIQVAPGKVSSIKVDFPKGAIALNAIPWADVWIDGEKVGQTPLGNLQVPIGSHEVTFRNPDLGEQTHTVVVSLKAPVRLSVDLRKK